MNQTILNSNIPSLKLLVRRSWLTKNPDDFTILDNCYAFAIQSVMGKILTFHIMTDYGMLRSRVPISELFVKIPKRDIISDYKQLWDCFSENVSVITYEYLCEKRCKVILKDKTYVWATYLFTIDWYDNPYSNEPSDYKCGHILVADEGFLLCQPNNRIFWKDANFITNEFPIPPQTFKVDSKLESVESKGDKWVTENNDSFYYDILKIETK